MPASATPSGRWTAGRNEMVRPAVLDVTPALAGEEDGEFTGALLLWTTTAMMQDHA
jgi:hypothetical protein